MIGMVLADLYTAISGIGYLIVRTASTFQVDKMFVPIVTLGLLGVTLTALLRFVENAGRAVDQGGAGRLAPCPARRARRPASSGFPAPGQTVAAAGGGIPLMFRTNQARPTIGGTRRARSRCD